MTPSDIKTALNEVLVNGVSLNATAYLVMVLGWIVASALGAYGGAFFGKRGETAAVKRDLEAIKQSLAQTTKVTEEIKADISGAALLKQKRLDMKWECYAEIVKSLGAVHTLISEALGLRQSSSSAQELETKKRGIEEAFAKFNQFGSIARIAVAPSVRTVLSRLGTEWNKAGGAAVQQGIVARWGWLVITDIARNDLFGEPREMSDEFVGDVDVRLLPGAPAPASGTPGSASTASCA
jgi:hypothetical protein